MKEKREQRKLRKLWLGPRETGRGERKNKNREKRTARESQKERKMKY